MTPILLILPEVSNRAREGTELQPTGCFTEESFLLIINYFSNNFWDESFLDHVKRWHVKPEVKLLGEIHRVWVPSSSMLYNHQTPNRLRDSF